MMHRPRVYFIRPIGMAGPIKIGCTRNGDERLSALSSWSPFKLEVIYSEEGDTRLERSVHAAFADYHSHREWFHPGERLLKAVARLLNGERIATVINLNEPHGDVNNVFSRPRRGKSQFAETAPPLSLCGDRTALSAAKSLREISE